MNGAPSTAARFSSPNASAFDDSGLSFMAGNNRIFGANEYRSTTNAYTLWTRPDRLSTDAVANLYTRSSVNFEGLSDPWGVNNSPVIDDNEIESVESNAEKAEEIPEISGTVEAVEGAAEISAASTPWTLAAIVNQQLGQVTSQAISTGMQNMSNQDFNRNIQSHGLNVGLNAQLIQNQQEQTIRNQELGGTIGSFFGPIGALIGHAVAGTVQANPNLLNTAGSFQGWINPQQTGIVASQTTSGDVGISEMADSINGQ